MALSSYFAFLTPAAGRRWLALGALGALSSQCQPGSPAEQPGTSPDPPKLETAVATPLPKFDVESHIMRQLALLPPAERNIAPTPMHRYQQLTRRFWLAQYLTDYLLKEAQKGPPDLPVFTQQLGLVQSHWRVLLKGIDQTSTLPPTMTYHLDRMKQTAAYQQAALGDLQADCAAQHPPHLDAAALATQPQVKKLLAPLLREPAPMTVHLN